MSAIESYKKVTTFKGNFFEIGQQQGAIYAKNGMNFDSILIDHELYEKQLEIYKKHYPELLKEFEGMANGGNFDKDKLIYNFITNELFYFRDRFKIAKACTIFGYKDSKSLFVGRNYDVREAEKWFEIYKVSNPERNAFIAVTDMGIDGVATAKPQFLYYNADDAINDRGLFIGITFAYGEEWSCGISCIHMTKLIAETCATVADAIKIFEKVPLCGPKNFFIADQRGDMAVVEHTSKKFQIVRPKNNILIQTNHYVDDNLAKEDVVLKHKPDHNTFIRYDETSQQINLEKEKFDLGSVMKILGRKGSQTCQDFPGAKTIWTLALNMTARKYQIYWNLLGDLKQQNLEI